MRLRTLNRRVIHWLTFKQLQYCKRCRQWKSIRDFQQTDEEGVSTHSRMCSRCQIQLPPRMEKV
jgi:uncharacterized paraquat-inducible protein A